MMPKRAAGLLTLTSTVLAMAGLGACSQGSPTSPAPPSVLAAKGGNGNGNGGSGAGGGGDDGGGPTVTAAHPASAPQGVTVIVRVTGTGFDDGSKVDFLLDGGSTDIQTNSTTFVDAQTLDAEISIGETAAQELYDIQVTTKRKKKGIGTELFRVVGATAELQSCTLQSGACAPGTAPGVYADGNGIYMPDHTVVFQSADGDLVIKPHCGLGRKILLVLPADPAIPPDLNPVSCGEGAGSPKGTGKRQRAFNRFQLIGLFHAQAGDIIGVASPPPDPNLGDSNFYFFSDESTGVMYDVVWQAGLYVESRLDNPAAGTTEWVVTTDHPTIDLAAAAELVSKTADTEHVAYITMPLRVTVRLQQ